MRHGVALSARRNGKLSEYFNPEGIWALSSTQCCAALALSFVAVHESGPGRYCCKSPKLPAANFSAVKKSDRRPHVNGASITLPRSPASLSSGDEVPHIFTLKSRVQPKEILITSAKRLLQQNLHEREVPRRPAKVG